MISWWGKIDLRDINGLISGDKVVWIDQGEIKDIIGLRLDKEIW